MELYNRDEKRVCTKERKEVSTVKREEIHKLIDKQLRKKYIRLSKLP